MFDSPQQTQRRNGRLALILGAVALLMLLSSMPVWHMVMAGSGSG